MSTNSIEPVAAPGSAIVPWAEAAAGGPVAARASIASHGESVAADLQPLGVVRGRRCARYELRVVNESEAALHCHAYAVFARSGFEAVSHPPMAVGARSVVTMAFDVPWSPKARFDRIIVELVGGDRFRMAVEAGPPPAPEDGGAGRWIAAGGAAAASGALLALAYFAAQPRIVALSVPPSALSGSSVIAAYATRGVGTVGFAFEAADGRRLSGGPLASRDGEVTVAIPAGLAADEKFVVRLEARGPFGAASRDAAVIAHPMPTPLLVTQTVHAALIESLSVEPERVGAGNPFVVHYRAVGDRGKVELLDGSGAVWDSAPLRGDGVARFRAPRFHDDRTLRVALHVERGASAVESSVGLLVSGYRPPKPSPPPDAPRAPITEEQHALALLRPGVPYAFAAGPVVAGSPIRVALARPELQPKLALMRADGELVGSVEPRANERVVTLRAPEVTQSETCYLAITLRSITGEEDTRLEPVVVMPRPPLASHRRGG